MLNCPAGEAGIVGPALSCFDVDLSAAFQPGAAPKSSSEAKRVAQQQATAQEARSMLGMSALALYTSHQLDARWIGMAPASQLTGPFPPA